ncbi:hypothetical protein LO772_30995 [Yinghuangia sp. ASG 101]|uniref:hypothetical protein n=1 Tax=Yinghuangia sp. ASG 101 TaxID=2896848 RepID=UPI001E632B4E|nr:hypothetical protein [Yinghuangia sp. ASG 101]UGQ11182.1 hypothetical protein LO772_30995 [Yinghuangia sp. ASG 101]
MARAQSLARARVLDRPATAYILPFRTPTGTVDIEVTWEDLARDAAWTERQLRGLGLERGQRALLTFSGFEGAWIRPVIEALRALGVVYGTADAMGWDHARTMVFHRELDLYAVLGLSSGTVERLGDHRMPSEMFQDTPVVWARPQAARTLRAAGVPAGVLAPLGPALAVECLQRHGAHVNAEEWQVSVRDHRLVVAPAAARAASGWGEVELEDQGRVLSGACPCGSTDPRVLFG